MKYIIFFIVLISLIYLNYNIKETFATQASAAETTQASASDRTQASAETTQASAAETTQASAAETTQASAAETVEASTVETTQASAAETVEASSDRTQASASDTTQASAAETVEAESQIINVNFNKQLTLYNISNDGNQFPYIETDKQCTLNSQCNKNEICGDDYGRCDQCEPTKCYKKLNKPMYTFDNSKSSYIEVSDIDNLNVSFKFSVIASTSNNNQMIVSGLNLWNIYIDDDTGQFTLFINNLDSKPLGISLTDIDELYTFKIIVKEGEIKIYINGESKTYSFYEGDKSIYDCNANNCLSGTCKSIMGKNLCEYNKLSYLYFGGNKSLAATDVDREFFDGYMGGFTFYDSQNKMCEFRGRNSIKSECENQCKNDNCSKEDCDDECKDLPICNFDSGTNVSRHAIDCMTKCINPENECDINYCKKQCWECGSNCYWIKNNTFSDEHDDGSGKPFPPKISLQRTSYDGTKVKIRWEPPNPGNSPINGYFSLVYKTYKQNEGLKIDKITSGLCSKYCEYVISNLIPEEDYSLVVKAYNNSGVGKSSNELKFKTKRKNINTDILNKIEDVSQYEVGNYSNDNFCGITEEGT